MYFDESGVTMELYNEANCVWTGDCVKQKYEYLFKLYGITIGLNKGSNLWLTATDMVNGPYNPKALDTW